MPKFAICNLQTHISSSGSKHTNKQANAKLVQRGQVSKHQLNYAPYRNDDDCITNEG